MNGLLGIFGPIEGELRFHIPTLLCCDFGQGAIAVHVTYVDSLADIEPQIAAILAAHRENYRTAPFNGLVYVHAWNDEVDPRELPRFAERFQDVLAAIPPASLPTTGAGAPLRFVVVVRPGPELEPPKGC